MLSNDDALMVLGGSDGSLKPLIILFLICSPNRDYYNLNYVSLICVGVGAMLLN